MKGRISSSWKSALILFPFAAHVAAGAEDGRILLEEVVAAHGGIERFRAIRDWRIVADRRLEGDPVASEIYQEYLLRDGAAEKTLLVKKREGSVLVFGHDGNTGFALTDGRFRDDEGARGEVMYAIIHHMKRTTIFLEESLERDLRALSRREGRPMAALVRAALAAYVLARQKRGRREPSFVAIGRSGRGDTAQRHEDLLWQGMTPHESAGKPQAGKARARSRRRTRVG